MTKVLVSPNNPDGGSSKTCLTKSRTTLLRRSAKIVDDARPEAREVLHNNIEIMLLLTQCSEKAYDSQRILNSLGPSGGRGARRIGG